MPERETDVASREPPGPPGPPAPPATGEPPRGPDPADPGPAIAASLGDLLLGDLGHPAVDAGLLSAILLRDGRVGAWLRGRGVDLETLDGAFPPSPSDKAHWR